MMLGCWVAAAYGALTAVPEHRAELVPGHVGSIVVAATAGSGDPDEAWPSPRIEGATVLERSRVREGVWRLTVAVDPSALQVRLRDGSDTIVVPVGLPPRARLSVRPRIDAMTTDGSVELRVAGPVALDSLGVYPGEGSVQTMVRDGDEVVITLGLPRRPVPRIVPVAVRDLSSDEVAVWTRVHLRARVPIAVAAEPGAALTLEVSGRRYGPFESDRAGTIEAVIDQYPGESGALGRIVDDLGNESEANLILGGRANAVLSMFAEQDYVTGGEPPLVHLFGSTAGGTPLPASPRCVSTASGEPEVRLPTARTAGGQWMVALPPSEVSREVSCTSADGATATIQVPRARSVPRQLRLRVAPVDLRSDLPLAEVRVELEDGVGDPMPLDGVTLKPNRGAIREVRRDVLLRAEYDGRNASADGGDLVVAGYQAPAGEGPARSLELGWGTVAAVGGGTMSVYLRALDDQRRPLVGAPLRAEVSGATRRATSSADGWATFTFEIPPGYDPVLLTGRIGSRMVRHIVHRGARAEGGPGTPDLREVRQIRIRPGRVAAINVDVVPRELRAGPGAAARVFVNLEDEAGRPLSGEDVELRATEGTITGLTQRPDGTWAARYVPNDDTRRRAVRITAETPTMRSSTQLVVEAPTVRASVGPWIGLSNNFGRAVRVAGGLDVDLRVKRLVARFGAQVSGQSFDLGAGEVSTVAVPLSLSALIRDERGRWAFWGGAGVSAGPLLSTVTTGDFEAPGAQLWGGPNLQTGVARRALGGEVALTLRYLWLLEVTPPGAVSYDNPVGLVAAVGYRLVY